MTRGHGELERFVLAALTHSNELTAAALAALRVQQHPNHFVRHELPSRSLRSSLNRAIRNLQKSGRIVRIERDGIVGWSICDVPGDRLRTAYHEAAHAVVARSLGIHVKSATIRPGPGRAGHVLHKGTDDDRLAAIISLAGKYGEWFLLDGDPRHPWYVSSQVRNYGAGSGHKNVRRRVIRRVGYPTSSGDILYDRREARAFRRRLENEAKQLVIEYRDAIKRVAEALIDRETLTADAVDGLIWE